MNSVTPVVRVIGIANRHVNVHFGMKIILKNWRLILPNNLNNGHGTRLSHSR